MVNENAVSLLSALGSCQYAMSIAIIFSQGSQVWEVILSGTKEKRRSRKMLFIRQGRRVNKRDTLIFADVGVFSTQSREPETLFPRKGVESRAQAERRSKMRSSTREYRAICFSASRCRSSMYSIRFRSKRSCLQPSMSLVNFASLGRIHMM